MTASSSRENKLGKYELVPPEGGWGYIITFSVGLFFVVTIVPLCVFGQVFGPFLGTIGDETYGTTLTNGIFNTVLSFTGILANYLLQAYSYRKVGLLGAILFFIGCLGSAFVTSLFQLIVTFGVLQGLGFGLLMPAGFTAFNGYFVKKQNLMMGLAQAMCVAVTMVWPMLTEKLLDKYGWRGTQLIFSALSLNCFVAMCTMQPVEWHMKKKPVTDGEIETRRNSSARPEEGADPLLDRRLTNSGNHHTSIQNHLHAMLDKKRRPSVISIGSMALSVGNINTLGHEPKKPRGVWEIIADSLDLGLFKEPTFVNIAFGLSLSLTADLAFLSLLPMILRNANYSPSDMTLVLTVYFGSDLVSRILFTVASVMVDIRNRHVFLAGSLLSAAFRTAFVMKDSLLWVASTAGVLGFLRCWIQTPLPLVVAEQYGPRFSTAFTLYMVVCGVVSVIFAPLIGFVKNVTQSDKMVVHLLTAAYAICGVTWTIELVCQKLRKKK